MAQLKTSILLELEDKFSKSFSKLNDLLGKSTSNTNKLEKSLSKNSNEFKKGSKEVQNYNNNFNNLNNNLKNGLKEIVLPAISFAQVSKMFKNHLTEAGNRQMLGIKLSTVIGDNNREEFEAYFKQIEQTGIASFQEIVDTGYNLLSAGLNGNQAKKGAKNVIDVATITSGDKASVASIMAGASQNFKEDMDKVGDILTKTQLKFKFSNFGQLGEGFANVASRASSMGLSIEQTATALGVLNNADISGGRAGTALSGVLRSLPKATEKLGLSNPYNKDGSLNLIGFLEEVNNKTKGLSKLEKSVRLQEIFGDEGLAGLLPLMEKLGDKTEDYSSALKDVTENSKNITNLEVDKFYEAYNTKVSKFRNTLSQLAGTMGNLLLPIVGGLLDLFSVLIHGIDVAVSKFPILGYVFLSLATFVALLSSYMLIMKGLSFFGWLLGGAKTLGVLRTAFIFTTGAIRAMTLAMISNPISALIFVLTSGAVLLITYWSEVKEFFINLFDWFSNNGFFKMMDKGIQIAKSLFSSEETKVAVSNDGVNKVREASMIGGNSSNSANTNNNQVYNINVSGSGQPVDTAKEVSKEIAKAEQLSMVGG